MGAEDAMRFRHRLVQLGIFGALAALWFVAPGTSQAVAQTTKQQIIDALSPVKTRGLTAPSARDQQGVDTLPKTRSLTLDERQRVATTERPQIDLEIQFAYNSAEVRPDAMKQVKELGEALQDPKLKGSTFLIAGHTDAKGSASYNRKLSERRAESVKRVLVREFDVPSDMLVTAGYGKDRLKNTADPYAAENRRVQVVNLDSKQTAGK
jgi:outer membrane protein OmpA-like peptidoglycan-associated protein